MSYRITLEYNGQTMTTEVEGKDGDTIESVVADVLTHVQIYVEAMPS